MIFASLILMVKNQCPNTHCIVQLRSWPAAEGVSAGGAHPCTVTSAGGPCNVHGEGRAASRSTAFRLPFCQRCCCLSCIFCGQPLLCDCIAHVEIKGVLLLTLVVQNWGTEEVAAWLDLLNLGEYKEIFIRHDIRGAELLHLERRDLKVFSFFLPLLLSFSLVLEHCLQRRTFLPVCPLSHAPSLACVLQMVSHVTHFLVPGLTWVSAFPVRMSAVFSGQSHSLMLVAEARHAPDHPSVSVGVAVPVLMFPSCSRFCLSLCCSCMDGGWLLLGTAKNELNIRLTKN